MLAWDPLLSWQEYPPAQKAVLKKIGSNFLLKDRTVRFSYQSPFDLVAKTIPAKNWLSLADEIRAHFTPDTPDACHAPCTPHERL
jgi:hypothetical protein